MRIPWIRQHVAVPESPSDPPNYEDEKTSFIRSTNPTIRKQTRDAGSVGLFVIWGTALNLVILSITFALYTSANLQCWGKTAVLMKSSHYSPVLDRIKLETSVKQIDGNLFPGPNPSIARQTPNPVADTIWEELELSRTIVISAEEVRKLGKDPATAAKFEDEYWGLGDNAYMAQMDVFHQLHCLNSLRKLVYPEYYENSNASAGNPPLWYIHNNHCIDILYQNIACTASTDLYTMNWMETQSRPFPDFSVNHQCRDFESLLEWRKDNSVNVEKWEAMKKPQNVKEVPAPEAYYELFGRQSPYEIDAQRGSQFVEDSIEEPPIEPRGKN